VEATQWKDQKVKLKYNKLFSKYIKVVSLFGFISVFILFFYILWKETYSTMITSYGVTATTERIEIFSEKEQGSKWIFENASIRSMDGHIYVDKFSGSIDIFDLVRIQVERVSRGPAIIRFYTNDNQPILKYTNYHNKDRLPESKILSDENGLEIILKSIEFQKFKGISHLFHFEGEVQLGKINEEVQYGEGAATLRSGEINMLGRNTIDSTSYFKAGEEYLRMGDRLEFPEKTIAVGYISINEAPALFTNYRAESKNAIIYKPGMKSQGYIINASTFDRWTNDKDFQRVSIVAGFLLVLVTFLTFILDLFSFFFNKN
jgi:hypothetical protein